MDRIIFRFPVLMLGFILTIQGFSYHTDNRDLTFNGRRTKNEIHNALGLEYEKKIDGNLFTYGAMFFKNSFYTRSYLLQTQYKWITKNRFYRDYIGLKAGIVTGYGQREVCDYPKRRKIDCTINIGMPEYLPFIFPTYSIKNKGYELEFMYLPRNPLKNAEDKTHIFIMLIKFEI